MMDFQKVKLFIWLCLACVLGDCLMDLDNKSLLYLLEECLVMAAYLRDSTAVMVLYQMLGDYYCKLKEYNKAIEYHKQLLCIAKDTGSKKIEGRAYKKLGCAFQSLAQYHEAIKYHEKSLSIAKEIGNWAGRGSSYVSLANAYNSLGEYHKVIECYEERLSISKEIGNRAGDGGTYGNIGNAYHSLGEYHKAIECQEKSIKIFKEIGNRAGEGLAYRNLGKAYQSLAKYHKAIECYEKRLSIAKEIDDKAGDGDTYRNMGIAYQLLGEYHKAIESHEKSTEIFKEIGDREGEGVGCRNLGDAYDSLAEYHKAIEYYENSLSISKEMDDRDGEGRGYVDLGNAYQSLEEYHRAIEYYEKSLAIAKENGNREGEGINCGNLGNAFQSLGEYDKAIEYNEKSLDILKEIGDRAGEGNIYGNLGIAYHSLGEYHKATEYHAKSLSIAKEVGNKTREGNCYGCLGIAYQTLGEYHKAIEYYEKSLSIVKEIGNRDGEGKIYGNLGSAYQSLGEYHKGIKYHEKSLDIKKEIGDRDGEGNTYGNLGSAYQSLGEYHKGIEYHEKSLDTAKEMGNKAREARNYENLGNAYLSLGETGKSIEYHEKSLSINKEIGNRAGEGLTYGNLGNAYHSLGEYHKAIEYHEKSLAIAKEIGDRRVESSAHRDIGICYSFDCSFKDLHKAEEHLRNSIDCYEKIFDDLKERDHLKISFVDTYVRGYKLLSEVQLETKQPEKALLVCDRGRARALKDLLSMKYNTNEKPASKQNSLELDDIKIISSSCNACILFYDIRANKLTARLWVVSPQSDSIYVYDEMAEHESLAKIVSNLTKDEKQNIKNGYFHHLVENSYYRMDIRDVVKCEDRSLESLQSEEDLDPAPSSTASKPNETARRVFKDLTRWVVDVDEDDDIPLEVLFQRLITPVLDKLTTDEIVIIPDGPLFMVPFAALKDPGTGKYLYETKRLRLAPSLTTLKILQESSHDHHYKSGALIIGDPAVGEVMYRGKLKRDIHPLSGARKEATEIGKLLGVEPLLGENATKEAVLGKLQHGVSVIHFAAHGSSQNGQIFLAPSQRSSTSAVPEEKDYILTMKDAQESGIRAQLVVLSCCHSGRGDIKSEGVVGMTRAFLAAGARAVVASLWAIDDQATNSFMLKFYSHLKDGKSASMSLQQAMKEMRETEEYKDPMYWAAFFLIGDDVTIIV